VRPQDRSQLLDEVLADRLVEGDPNIAFARQAVRQSEGVFQQASGRFDNKLTPGQTQTRLYTSYVTSDPTQPTTYSTDSTRTPRSSSWLLRTGRTQGQLRRRERPVVRGTLPPREAGERSGFSGTRRQAGLPDAQEGR